MRPGVIVALALVAGIGVGGFGADQLTGPQQNQQASGEAAQRSAASRGWPRQQRRAAAEAREVFPSGRVVEVERENVGRAHWEVELLVDGELYEVRLDPTFGLIGFEREAAGEASAHPTRGSNQ